MAIHSQQHMKIILIKLGMSALVKRLGESYPSAVCAKAAELQKGTQTSFALQNAPFKRLFDSRRRCDGLTATDSVLSRGAAPHYVDPTL
jgi:hypothetical protein